MLKFIGALCILSAFTIFGFVQSRQYSRRPRQIRQLISLLQRMETEISFGFTHLPEALRTISVQVAHPLNIMLLRMADQLRAESGKSVKEVWQAAIEESWYLTAMKKTEKEIISQLGFTLGMTDREDQVKHLRLGIVQLQAEEQQARDEQQRYEKMWKSLGVLAGAFVVILIY